MEDAVAHAHPQINAHPFDVTNALGWIEGGGLEGGSQDRRSSAIPALSPDEVLNTDKLVGFFVGGEIAKPVQSKPPCKSSAKPPKEDVRRRRRANT